MSGGHFNSNRYIYYEVERFADELELEILNNSRPDEWGGCPNFDEKLLARLRTWVPQIRQTARVMKELDWLYSGDHGEESFLNRLDQIEKPSGQDAPCGHCDTGCSGRGCVCSCNEIEEGQEHED